MRLDFLTFEKEKKTKVMNLEFLEYCDELCFPRTRSSSWPSLTKKIEKPLLSLKIYIVKRLLSTIYNKDWIVTW